MQFMTKHMLRKYLLIDSCWLEREKCYRNYELEMLDNSNTWGIVLIIIWFIYCKIKPAFASKDWENNENCNQSGNRTQDLLNTESWKKVFCSQNVISWWKYLFAKLLTFWHVLVIDVTWWWITWKVYKDTSHYPLASALINDTEFLHKHFLNSRCCSES